MNEDDRNLSARLDAAKAVIAALLPVTEKALASSKEWGALGDSLKKFIDLEKAHDLR